MKKTLLLLAALLFACLLSAAAPAQAAESVSSDTLVLGDESAEEILALAERPELVRIDAGDFRAEIITRKDLANNAACILVYASDSTKNRTPETKFPAIHVGEASQDVYLYCASKGLGTVSLGMYEEAAVRKVFKLDGKMTVILAQAVGFPAK